MKSVNHTTSFELSQSIKDLFPLFSPEGEKYWIPGWDYENVMGTTELSVDYVFLAGSHDHNSSKVIWIVNQYDKENHMVQFYKIEPDNKIGVVTVKCTELGPERTKTQVTYKYMALTAKGERFIAEFNSCAYEEFIGEWHTLLTEYFGS